MAITVFCTDVDIAEESPDFRALCPPDDMDAYGTDGTIDPELPWVLTSATVNFAANKVQPGKVIYLRKEGVYGTDPGEAFAVHSQAPDAHSLTLRRKSKTAPEDGEPPGSRTDPIIAIEFDILTLQRMIEDASNEIDEKFGISRALGLRPGQQLADQDALLLRKRTVYTVLKYRYLAISRGTTVPGAKEVNQEKSNMYAQRIIEMDADMLIRFSTGEGVQRHRPYRLIAQW
jgi:hypothetical protein